MLTTMAVMAVVGGTPAFKAQKFEMKRICSEITLNQCTILNIFMTTTDTGQENYFYTQVPQNWTNCNRIKECPLVNYLTYE